MRAPPRMATLRPYGFMGTPEGMGFRPILAGRSRLWLGRIGREEGNMAFVEWEMQGVEFANCNCHTGCPCQFNALPDKGHCRAHTFVQIEKGRYGKVPLDGLRWGILAFWPGPIHLGGG